MARWIVSLLGLFAVGNLDYFYEKRYRRFLKLRLRKEPAYNILARDKHMPKKEKLIEPIPATMKEVVGTIFANHPKPRDPEKEREEQKSEGITFKLSRNLTISNFKLF